MNPLYLLIALQVADIVTTVIALQGPAHESNPILKKIMDRIGVVPTLLIVKGGFIAFLWYYQATLPVEVLGMLCVFYAWIVVNNIQTIKKGKQ
jgi:hypothetical protein